MIIFLLNICVVVCLVVRVSVIVFVVCFIVDNFDMLFLDSLCCIWNIFLCGYLILCLFVCMVL